MDGGLKSQKRAGRVFRPASSSVILGVFPNVVYAIVYDGVLPTFFRDASGFHGVEISIDGSSVYIFPSDWNQLERVIGSVRNSLITAWPHETRLDQIKSEIRKVFKL